MLVLSRRKNQTIRIGKDIRITILDVRGEQVSVGIDAPKTIDIYREEVFEEVFSQNVAAIRENIRSGKEKKPPDGVNFPIDSEE